MIFKSFLPLQIFSNHLKSVPGIPIEHRIARIRDHLEAGPGIVTHQDRGTSKVFKNRAVNQEKRSIGLYVGNMPEDKVKVSR